MQFRYRLAKDLFKDKKVPPKNDLDESHVSADQRRGAAKPRPQRADNLLSLDGQTISAPADAAPEKKTPGEMSRRDLFGLFGLGKEEAAAAPPPPAEKIAKKKKKTPELAETAGVAVNEAPPAESSAAEEPPAASTPAAAKEGIFKRLWRKTKGVFGVEVETPPAAPVAVAMAAAASGAVTAQANGPAENAAAPGFFDILRSGDDEPDPEDHTMDRRHLFREGVQFFAKPMLESVQEKIDGVNQTLDKITKRVPLLRPPGAISERLFLQACTRCDACIHACPKDAIRKAPKEMGLLVVGTPYINPAKTPCVMCDTLHCIEACQDKALLPVPSKFEVRMGYAILDKAKCQAYGDIFCQQCVIDCPIPGAITQNKMRPVIHKDICTGCGVCVRSCGTVNIPVAIKVKPQMVIESQILKKKMEEEKARQEAERAAAKKREEEAAAAEAAAAHAASGQNAPGMAPAAAGNPTASSQNMPV